MLIWYANIPEETTYFKPRLQGAYKAIFWINFVVNFIAPILILMTRGSKRNYAIITFMGILLVGHWLDFDQMVMPGSVGDHLLGWYGGERWPFYRYIDVLYREALAKAPLVPVSSVFKRKFDSPYIV